MGKFVHCLEVLAIMQVTFVQGYVQVFLKMDVRKCICSNRLRTQFQFQFHLIVFIIKMLIVARNVSLQVHDNSLILISKQPIRKQITSKGLVRFNKWRAYLQNALSPNPMCLKTLLNKLVIEELLYNSVFITSWSFW